MGTFNSFLRNLLNRNSGEIVREDISQIRNSANKNVFIPENEPRPVETRPSIGFDHGQM